MHTLKENFGTFELCTKTHLVENRSSLFVDCVVSSISLRTVSCVLYGFIALYRTLICRLVSCLHGRALGANLVYAAWLEVGQSNSGLDGLQTQADYARAWRDCKYGYMVHSLGGGLLNGMPSGLPSRPRPITVTLPHECPSEESNRPDAAHAGVSGTLASRVSRVF